MPGSTVRASSHHGPLKVTAELVPRTGHTHAQRAQPTARPTHNPRHRMHNPRHPVHNPQQERAQKGTAEGRAGVSGTRRAPPYTARQGPQRGLGTSVRQPTPGGARLGEQRATPREDGRAHTRTHPSSRGCARSMEPILQERDPTCVI